VDTETTLSYQIAYFIDPNLAAIIHFEGTSRHEATIHDGEHRGMKKRAVLVVERAIDEDVSRRVSSRPRSTFWPPPRPAAAHALPSLKR
jgi:hypothetical protein